MKIKEKDEKFIVGFLSLAIGTYGCLLDFLNGMEILVPTFLNIIPEISELNSELFPDMYPLGEVFKYNINSMFFLLSAFGSMLLFTTISDIRAKYTLTGYLKLILLKAKQKYYNGILERDKWILDIRWKNLWKKI